MSVKIMGMVWDLDIPRHEKYVLLAYADHASHDGTGIFPAVATIARKTGYGERAVQAITRRLEKRGLLIPAGQGPNGTNKWSIPAPGSQLEAQPRVQPGGVVPPERHTPDTTSGVQILRGAESAPVQKTTTGGAEISTRGVNPAAPEPSLNRHEPSHSAGGREISKIIADADRTVDGILATQADPGRSYPNREKIPEPYRAFADTYHELSGQVPSKRVLMDWIATFSDWQQEGLSLQHIREAYSRAEAKFAVVRPGSLTNLAVSLAAKSQARHAQAAAYDPFAALIRSMEAREAREAHNAAAAGE